MEEMQQRGMKMRTALIVTDAVSLLRIHLSEHPCIVSPGTPTTTEHSVLFSSSLPAHLQAMWLASRHKVIDERSRVIKVDVFIN